MIRSMTGYGRGECTLYDRRFLVEIKSVNHRYNDITVKLPRIMNTFEDIVRKTVSTHVFRGKTDVYISYETLSNNDVKIKLNQALADSYVSELETIKQRYHLNDDISLELIARFPDILSIDKEINDDKILAEIGESLGNAVDKAVSQLIFMRELEGDALKTDILKKLEAISAITRQIDDRAPLVAIEYKMKLKQKLEEALKDTGYDESRLLTEVTIFVDRACIDEELTRLLSHIEQLKSILEQGPSVGRKLDFLVQEMNREVNTIGSKSNDIEITKFVVELKSEIEKIREQVQNIE